MSGIRRRLVQDILLIHLLDQSLCVNVSVLMFFMKVDTVYPLQMADLDVLGSSNHTLCV